MKMGTRSVLFGVHQFLWHPWTVARAWRHIYGRWPNFDEWICIACHDTPGYWGCPNMDGEEGRRHPERGAEIAERLVYLWYRLRGHPRIVSRLYAAEAFDRTIAHSSHYARMRGMKPSALYLPDKASILFEPRWFYLLRARLSGEIYEYLGNSPFADIRPTESAINFWYLWYRENVKQKLNGARQ